MGSRSSTSYSSTNLAPIITDNENPIVLTGSSGTRIASDDVYTNLSGGSSINTLDGGAIAGAFEVTKDSVASVLDLTAKLLQQNSTNASQYLSQVKSTGDEALKFVSSFANKDMEIIKKLMIGVGVLGGLYIVFNYGKWGKK